MFSRFYKYILIYMFIKKAINIYKYSLNYKYINYLLLFEIIS